MRFATETFGAVASLALLTACGAGGDERPASAIGSTAVAPETVVDGPAVLGAPYTESGVTYTPQDNPLYDEVGYAGTWMPIASANPLSQAYSSQHFCCPSDIARSKLCRSNGA